MEPVCFARVGARQGVRAEGQGKAAGEGAAIRTAAPAGFARRPQQVEQKLHRLISAARTRPARRPGSNLQHRRSRGAGISSDSN